MDRVAHGSLNAPARPLAGAAMTAWVLLPAATAVALASEVRPASAWPDPAVQWGCEAVLLVQIVLSSLIYPRLLVGWREWITVTASGGAVLAGGMAFSGRSTGDAAVAWLWLMAWLGGLTTLSRSWERAQMRGALLGLVVAGLLTGVYMEAEAGGVGLRRLLPVPARGSTFHHWLAWTGPAAVMGAGVAGIFLRKISEVRAAFRKKSQLRNTLSTR